MARVVAGVSPFGPRPELVSWAAGEAASRGATLELVTATPARAETDPGSPVARAALTWAATLAAQCQPGLAVVTGVVPGPPEQALRAAAAGADLLVVGADDQSAFVEAITGSVPGALLISAPCPMVVVPKDAEPADDAAPVLVGVDTAEGSWPALEYAFAAAARSGRTLSAVLCATTPRDRDEHAERQHALSDALAWFTERYPGVPATDHIVDVDPTEELTRRSRRAALLVLGSRGRGRLASMAFGSVSRTLIRRGHCPVAVLGPGVPAIASAAS